MVRCPKAATVAIALVQTRALYADRLVHMQQFLGHILVHVSLHSELPRQPHTRLTGGEVLERSWMRFKPVYPSGKLDTAQLHRATPRWFNCKPLLPCYRYTLSLSRAFTPTVRFPSQWPPMSSSKCPRSNAVDHVRCTHCRVPVTCQPQDGMTSAALSSVHISSSRTCCAAT